MSDHICLIATDRMFIVAIAVVSSNSPDITFLENNEATAQRSPITLLRETQHCGVANIDQETTTAAKALYFRTGYIKCTGVIESLKNTFVRRRPSLNQFKSTETI